jgi:hypothetical protein
MACRQKRRQGSERTMEQRACDGDRHPTRTDELNNKKIRRKMMHNRGNNEISEEK